MAGDVREDDGVIRRDGIELLAIREPLVRPKRVIPSTAGDPFSFFVMRNRFGQALLHFLYGSDAPQFNCQRVGPGAAQVHVRVVKAGHDKETVEANGFCALLASAAVKQYMI